MPSGYVMPQKRKSSSSTQKPPIRKHISQASITRQTVNRYYSAMNSFFAWRRSNGLYANPTYKELDVQLGRYLNHLYQRDMPLYLGTNCIAGFRKFHPRCKPQLNTASSWLMNWTRSIRTTRAMPLHPKLVKRSFPMPSLIRTLILHCLCTWVS